MVAPLFTPDTLDTQAASAETVVGEKVSVLGLRLGGEAGAVRGAFSKLQSAMSHQVCCCDAQLVRFRAHTVRFSIARVCALASKCLCAACLPRSPSLSTHCAFPPCARTLLLQTLLRTRGLAA